MWVSMATKRVCPHLLPRSKECLYGQLLNYRQITFLLTNTTGTNASRVSFVRDLSTMLTLINRPVMRACESCRKRKIKCDAATTNQWPCGSCVRLKSSCNPPAINPDRAHAGVGNISGLERVLDFDNSSGSGDDDYSHQDDAPALFEIQDPPDYMNMAQQPYGTDLGSFNTPPYSDTGISQQAYSYDDITSMAINAPNAVYHDPTAFHVPHSASLPPSEYEQYHHTDLSDALGELKINENGVGM